METLSQDSLLECQICFNYYSPRRRPKLLDCKHTCCSVCLQQMRTSQKDLRCPWCRGITKLPPGFSVSQLPDDPEVIAVIAIPHTSEHTPVFIKLPSNGCYMLPLPISKERALLPGDIGCRLLPGSQQKSVTVMTIPAEQQPLQGGMPQEVGEEEQDRRGVVKSSTWSGVCTVILVACVLVFLLGIVLHNMSCISKRFTVISCGWKGSAPRILRWDNLGVGKVVVMTGLSEMMHCNIDQLLQNAWHQTAVWQSEGNPKRRNVRPLSRVQRKS